MRHDWIYDVLSDLKTYAVANGLIALAVKADEALVVAHAEIKHADSMGLAPRASRTDANFE